MSNDIYFSAIIQVYTSCSNLYMWINCPSINVVLNGVNPNNKHSCTQRFSHFEMSIKYRYMIGITNFGIHLQLLLTSLLMLLIDTIYSHVYYTNIG